MTIQTRLLTLAAAGLWLGAVAVPAGTLTFDELPFQPVDGLTFKRVTFGFEVGGVPSADASYNSGGPGTTVFIDDPSLEGDAAGILELVFDNPVGALTFGLALTTFEDLTPGAIVGLYDGGGVLIDSIALDLSPLVSFSEGQFSWAGVTPVTRAVLDFDDFAADRFVMDNLSFKSVVVPESGTIFAGFFWAVLIAMDYGRRWRNSGSRPS